MARERTGRRKGRRRAGRGGQSGAQAEPVRPGLSSGTFRPLTEREIVRIHDTALDVLEKVGVSGATSGCIGRFEAAGGRLDDVGRLCVPRGLVEDLIALVPKSWHLFGHDDAHNIEFSGTRVHMSTGGSAVYMLDHELRAFRDTTLRDLYDNCRLVDSLDNIHCCQRTVIARDMGTARDLDINTAYAVVSGTRKPCGISLAESESVEPVVAMLDMIAGGDGKFREHPFCWLGATFMVPPLRAAEEAQRSLEILVQLGVPYLYAAVPQAGTTGPASLAGTLVQSFAEALFVLCYVQLVAPGHPFLFGCWPCVSDLRTGGFCGGSGEQAVLMAAAAQMTAYYGLPSNVAAGMTDSKVVDVQSGYEKGYSIALAALAGANVVWAYPGMLASLLVFSQEQLIVDNEILGNVMRMVRGLETEELDLSFGVIAEAAIDPGHFIAHGQTLDRMMSDFLYPEISDRSSPNEWMSAGRPDIVEHAHRRVRTTLDTHFPDHISPRIDERIREHFDIKLPRDAMSSERNRANGDVSVAG